MNKSGKIIYPLSATTETCFEIFSRLNVRFEVIYIDASHDYAPVYRDIDSSFEILSETGVLIGDDFENWDSVKQAVKDFASLKELKLLAGEGQWMLYSDNNDRTKKLVSELYSCGWTDVEIPSQIPSVELLFQREISKNYLLQVQVNELKLIKESSTFKLMSIWHQIKTRAIGLFQK